ncbi:preprotein translocase subunit SecY [Candidatus Marinamargulisbacteria bacterium SCGC AG-343-D04]|nr:preprotein translocase subunit SecY [Candidatus Marinamargulisbacteria bacterium SCGC AG-343-D04]
MNLLTSIFSIKQLKEKILYSLIIVLVYRLGTHIPIPGIDIAQLETLFSNSNVLGFVNLFSGGALSRFSIFALGILPYINASIIMQLLMIIWPSLKEIAEEGEPGRKLLSQYTRYLAVALALFQSIVMSFSFQGFLLPDVNSVFFIIYAVASLTAGATLVMWFGELITENGIGNGASILIFIGIIAQMPMYISNTILLVKSGANMSGVVILFLMFIIMIFLIVLVQEAERKVSVQYAKRVVGRKLYGAQNTYIPLRLIQGGVMPIIFASAVLQFPLLFSQYFPNETIKVFFNTYYQYDGIAYNAFFCILIFFFTYFYTAITFNPQDLADNIRKHGGFIMGVRPGNSTVIYLEKIITTLTFIGAFFLAFVALIPIVTANSTNINTFMGLGGTALLILVGVAMDLVKQIDSIVISDQYEKLTL